MKNQDSMDDISIREITINILLVILFILTVPLYLLFTVFVNSVLLIQYLVGIGKVVLLRCWYQVVGTATLQRRLEGDVLAAKGDVLRFALEIFENYKREMAEGSTSEVSLEEINNFKKLIGFSENTPRRQFKPYIPGLQSLERSLRKRDLSELVTGSIVAPLSTDESAQPEQVTDEFDSFPPDLLWALTAMGLLNEAERNLHRNTETAFRAYLRAERYLVFAEYMLYIKEKEQKRYKKIPNPLLSRAMMVYSSILPFKMKEQEFVADLLLERGSEEAHFSEIRKDLSIIELDRAIEILDQYRLESYRNIESLRVNLLSFISVSTFLIIVILIYFPGFLSDSIPEFGYLPTLIDVPLLDGRVSFEIQSEQLFFGIVLIFGAIGAAISGIRTIEQDSESIKSLQQILGYWLAAVRMMVGSISAFIVILFLFSGIVDEQFLTLPLVLGAAIAAGFSERLLIRAISSFGDRAVPETRGIDDTRQKQD